MTYGELLTVADGVAELVQRSLPHDGSPVAVVGHKEPEFLASILGAVKAGHPYVPLDVSLPHRRREQIVSAAGARLVLMPERVASLRGSSMDPRWRWIEPDSPFYIMFTSGSTGDPKGVVITLSSLTSFVGWLLEEHQFAERAETFLNQAPFSFDLSVMDLFASLATGGTLYSLTAEQIGNPREMYRALATSGITTWVSTPSFARLCLAEPTFDSDMLPDVSRFLFCGEILPPRTVAELLDRFPNAAIWNTYGPTEATVATTSVRVDRSLLARYSSLPVGYPKPDSRIFIFDDADRPLRPGERGEIIIAGPHVSAGYLGRPDLDERAFFEIDGLRAYRTGDRGTLLDGMLFFDGRADGQVKLHGYRIELGDVEAQVRALPGVRDVVVLAIQREGVVAALGAVVILAERSDTGDPHLVRRLRGELAERLPAYMLPRRWMIVDAFPVTANGKIDRRVLTELLDQESALSPKPPRTT